MKVAIVCYCLYQFTGFSKIIHVWIFIKMCLFLLVYFFILSVNLKQIHLIGPLPSVFISLFIVIILDNGCMAGRLLQRAVQKQLVCLFVG